MAEPPWGETNKLVAYGLFLRWAHASTLLLSLLINLAVNNVVFKSDCITTIS